MSLKQITLISALAISACATTKPAYKNNCQEFRAGSVCTKHYNHAEEAYFTWIRGNGTKFCGIRITYDNYAYTLLKDEGCDGTVDFYAKDDGKSEFEITRKEDPECFESIIDKLFKERKEDLLK